MNKKNSLLVFFVVLIVAVPPFLFSGDNLIEASYNSDIKKVQNILKGDVDFDKRDSFGGTALHAAMFQDNTKIIELLIDAGHDINVQGIYNKYTPLHDAVWANNLEAVKILIRYGAKTDIKGRDGQTAYEKAISEDKKEIADYLKVYNK